MIQNSNKINHNTPGILIYPVCPGVTMIMGYMELLLK
jgi:hypothetical protein